MQKIQMTFAKDCPLSKSEQLELTLEVREALSDKENIHNAAKIANILIDSKADSNDMYSNLFCTVGGNELNVVVLERVESSTWYQPGESDDPIKNEQSRMNHLQRVYEGYLHRNF